MKLLLFKNTRPQNLRADSTLAKQVKFSTDIDILSKKIAFEEEFEVTAEDLKTISGLKERLVVLENAGFITFIGEEVVAIEKMPAVEIPNSNETFARVRTGALQKSQEARFKKLLDTAKK